MTRNLMFYCYPRTAGQRWRRSVNHLLARWSIFTGRKLVTISVDPCCDNPDDVIEAFGDRGCEFRVVENVPGLQEAAHFGPMLRDLETSDPEEITLYAHAKGCTHPDKNAPSHLWCDAMAAACTDYEQLIDCAMKRGNVCGAFRVHSGWGFPGYHDWHFAGTYFWYRNSRALELGIRDCQPVFYGAEALPGAFPKEESVCLFFDNTNSHDLYQLDFWQTNVGPSLKWWHKNLQKCGLTPLAETSSEGRQRNAPRCPLARRGGSIDMNGRAGFGRGREAETERV